MYYVIDTFVPYKFFFQSVLLQPLEAALVRTNYKLFEGKLRVHLLFVCTKKACKRL